MKFELYTISAMLMMSVGVVLGMTVPPCEDGMFYNADKESGGCEMCAVCPINTVILTPCEYFDNTKCGPFMDFFDFEQKSGQSSINRAVVEITKDSSTTTAEVTVSPEEIDNGIFFEISDEWYMISMILLGILCFISLIIALYIIFACFVCKKNPTKEIVYESEYMAVSKQVSPESTRFVETMVTASPDVLQGCLTSLVEGGQLMKSPNIYINHHYIEPKDSLLHGLQKS